MRISRLGLALPVLLSMGMLPWTLRSAHAQGRPAGKGEIRRQKKRPEQQQNAPGQNSARQPRGIYAVVLDSDHRPYAAIIDNPAISGMFLYFHWATLEPQQGQFDFSLVEQAFSIAESKHKSGYEPTSRGDRRAAASERNLDSRVTCA